MSGPFSTVSRRARGVALALLLALGISPGAASEEQEVQLDWQAGPMLGAIGDSLAEIDLPEGYVILGSQDTQRLMDLMQNPVSGDELAFVAPEEEGLSWFLVFEWDESGWVDDAERDELDADAMLQSIREAADASNEERRRRGWSTMEIVGWHEPPHYDSQTNNLTWAIKGRADGRVVINRLTKLLGRRGVMTVTLVSGPEELAAASSGSDRLLAGYRFQSGNTYAEYLPGTDNAAAYGLTALVVGGAGAALVKSGLLARFWKLLVVGALGVAGFAKRIFSGRQHIQDPPTQV